MQLTIYVRGTAQEESSEYETDSEDETNARQLLKPVFVRKSEREVTLL